VSDGELAHEEPYRVLLRLLVQRDPGLASQLLRNAGYLVEPPEAGEPEPVDVQLSEGAAGDVLDLSLNMLDEADGREPRLPAGDVWFGDGTAKIEGMRVGQTLFVIVHTPERCAGRPCPLHNPSAHQMRTWPMRWRSDRHLMERRCVHLIGHPDPDDVAYQESVGLHGVGLLQLRWLVLTSLV
jgi:hypothetical protein